MKEKNKQLSLKIEEVIFCVFITEARKKCLSRMKNKKQPYWKCEFKVVTFAWGFCQQNFYILFPGIKFQEATNYL